MDRFQKIRNALFIQWTSALMVERKDRFFLIILYLLLFVVGIEALLISPLLPKIASDLNSTETKLAGVISMYLLVYALIAPIFGFISNKKGKNIFFCGGILLFSGGNFLLFNANDLKSFFIGKMLIGVGIGISGPIIWSFISDIAPRNFRGTLISLGVAVLSLSQIVGVPIGIILEKMIGWQKVFLIICFIALLLLFFILYLIKPNKKKSIKANLNFNFFRGKYLFFFLITFVWAVVNLGFYNYLGILLTNHFKLDLPHIGLIITIMGISSFVGAFMGGHFADYFRAKKKNELYILKMSGFFMFFSILGFFLFDNLQISMLFLIVWYFFSNIFFTTQQTFLTFLSESNTTALFSINNSIIYIGGAAGIWFFSELEKINVIGLSISFLVLLKIALTYCLKKYKYANYY